MQGKRFEPYTLKDELDVETPPGPNISTADSKGSFQPSSPALNITTSEFSGDDNTTLSRRNQCSGNTVSLSKRFNAIFGKVGGNPNSPSGSKAGNVVFATANRFAAVSLTGGDFFFRPIDVSVFAGPGFCCNQVVQYIPKIKRFVWLLEYSPDGHHGNKLRLITFRPQDVDASGPTSWLYLDIYSMSDLNLRGRLVFGDLAVGDHKLWVSATATGVGLVVIRIPIYALDHAGPLTYWYTDPADGAVAYLYRLAQNPGDTAFWAGHSVLGTILRVFKWPEYENTYYWSDLAINPWPANPHNFVAPCPGRPTTSWVDNSLGRILGATRRHKKEVWFAWAASKGGGFPNVHIQVAQIDPSNWPAITLTKQWPIWNPSHAFAYPALYTNECHDVGLAVAFGSGPYNPSSAVGIADSGGVLTSTVYAPELSDVCQRRFGNYLTVRKGEGKCFGGYIYAGKPASPVRWRSRYWEFGRG